MQKGFPWQGCCGLRGLGFVLVFVTAIFATFDAEARVLTPPTGKPTCYADAVASTMIEVKWTDIEGETQYRIERLSPTGWVEVKAAGGGSGSPMGGHFLDTNLEPRKQYVYRVRGWNPNGFSEYSNEAAATTWAD